MKITNETIPLIEKALGFTLYNWQRAYLLGEPHTIPTERATGRTTAYIVKLLLTNREPINIKFEAMKYKDHQGVLYTHFFRNFMREIDEKLTTVGLPTCSVKPQCEHKQVLATMGIDLDTKRFELKLRAIAKHCEALANELEAIDHTWQCECGCTEYVDEGFINSEVIYTKRICNNCGAAYVIDDDLSTRLEGSE